LKGWGVPERVDAPPLRFESSVWALVQSFKAKLTTTTLGSNVVRGDARGQAVQQESTATLGGNRWTPADCGGRMASAQGEVFKR
jgi:hypothetical protein